MSYNIELNELIEYCKTFIGFNREKLIKMFGIQSHNKAVNYLIAMNILNSYKGDVYIKKFISDNNIIIKTSQIYNQKAPKESMSFSVINYMKIINEEWESSDFKAEISKMFIMFIFDETNGENKLLKVFSWTMPIKDLEGEVRLVWTLVKKCLIEGKIVKQIIDGKEQTFFPSMKETKVCHVRPHGKNSMEVVPLPVPDKNTGFDKFKKVSFWLNKGYITDIINNN